MIDKILWVQRIKQNKQISSLLVVFFLVYFNLSSLAVNVRIENALYAIVSLGFVLAIFLYKVIKKEEIHFDLKLLFLTIIAILSVLLNIFLTSDKNILNYVILSQIISAFIVACFVDYEDFVDSFIVTMVFLSVYSLVITYVVSPFLPMVSSLFPTRINSTGEMLRDYIFAFKFIGSYTLEIRNTGIFREMGVYSIYVNLALTFYLFMQPYREKNIKVIGVFVITTLSTLSTTGIMQLVLIMIAYIVFYVKKIEIKTFALSIGGGSILLLVISRINTSFIGQIGNSVNKFANQGSSYQVRTAAMIGNILAWLEKPIFGNGIDMGLERANLLHLGKFSIHNTSTTTSFLAIYGIVFTLIVTIPILLLFVEKVDGSFVVKFLVIAGFFLSINSQRLIYDQFMYVLYFCYFMNSREDMQWER